MIKPLPPRQGWVSGRRESARGGKLGGAREGTGELAVPPGDVGSPGRWSRDAWRSPHRSRAPGLPYRAAASPGSGDLPAAAVWAAGTARIPPFGLLWGACLLPPARPCPSLLPRRLESLPGEAIPGRPSISAASPAGHQTSAKLAPPGTGHLGHRLSPAPPSFSPLRGGGLLHTSPPPSRRAGRLRVPGAPGPFGRSDAALETEQIRAGGG